MTERITVVVKVIPDEPPIKAEVLSIDERGMPLVDLKGGESEEGKVKYPTYVGEDGSLNSLT